MSNSPNPVSPDTINRLRVGVPMGMALLAGMQLDLFSALKDGPRTAAQIAGERGYNADRLRALCNALVVAGLLTVEGEQFTNSREADTYLVQGKPSYMGFAHRIMGMMWDAQRTTGESVRTGIPQAKIDWDTMPADQLEMALRGLHSGAMADARELLKRYDFSAVKTVADIGGGSGGMALGLTEARPDMRAVIYDLPTVTPITRNIIAEAGGAERVSVETHNVVHNPLPEKFDAIVIRNVLQVLSAADARALLLNAAKALNAGGLMIIIGTVLDDSRLSPLSDVVTNLFFLNVYDHGQAYTEGQHRAWLSEAGLTDVRRVPPRTDYIAARKPA